MRNYEYFLHGTSHPDITKDIHREGIKAVEGRPTVSPSLIYSFNYAFDKEKGGAAKMHTEKEAKEPGTMFVLRLPEELKTGLETRALDLTVDEDTREIKNLSKYLGGHTKLALFGSPENHDLFTVVAMKVFGQKKVEDTKRFLAKYFGEKKLKIDLSEIALKAEPTLEMAQILKALGEQIKNLETIDIDHYVENLATHFKRMPGRDDLTDDDVNHIISELIKSTIESEITSLIRSLSVGLLRAKGFSAPGDTPARVERYGLDEKNVMNRLNLLYQKTNSDNFFFHSETLTEYIKTNIQKLFEEMNKK